MKAKPGLTLSPKPAAFAASGKSSTSTKSIKNSGSLRNLQEAMQSSLSRSKNAAVLNDYMNFQKQKQGQHVPVLSGKYSSSSQRKPKGAPQASTQKTTKSPKNDNDYVSYLQNEEIGEDEQPLRKP